MAPLLDVKDSMASLHHSSAVLDCGAHVGTRRQYPAGAVIYGPVDNVDDLFVLERGRVRLQFGATNYAGLVESAPVEIEAGAAFGTEALVPHAPSRSARAIAVTDVSVFQVPQRKLDASVASGSLGQSPRSTLMQVLNADPTSLRERLHAVVVHAGVSRVALEERINFEQLMTLFVSTFLNVEGSHVESMLESSLVLLCGYFDADLVSLYSLGQDDEALTLLAGWASGAAKDSTRQPRQIRLKEIPYIWARASEHDTVAVRRLRELPAEAKQERARFEAQGINAAAWIPLILRGRVEGILAIDALEERPRWSRESLSLLRVIGEILHHAISRQKQEESLHRLAHYDQLTGFPNRLLFMELLEKGIGRAARTNTLLGVLHVDMDRFKRINDSLGHGSGDILLQGVAARMQACMRQSDTVARIGGDEFAVMLEGLSDPSQAANAARKLQATLVEPLALNGHEIIATGSIGIATFPESGTDAGSLMQAAESAMHLAKEHGRGSYKFHLPSLNTLASERLAMETSLKRALERNELEVHCQPQLRLEDGAMVGAEALIRWRHPERGMISPGAFLPVAEETGLIVPMSEWIVGEACHQRTTWNAEGLQSTRVAVNVTGRWLKDPNFVESIQKFMKSWNVDPTWLELELTEEILLSDAEASADILQRLRDMGVQIALDDFGTGYSSLSYLRRLPVDLLKIDQSFVRNVETSDKDAAIVSAMVDLGHTLGLEVIAEGVETQEQLEFLRDSGCDIVQGFLLGKPQAHEDFLGWLEQYSPQATSQPVLAG